MADDWQAGDLALCVNAGEISCPHGSYFGISGFDVGETFVVSRVMTDREESRLSGDIDSDTACPHCKVLFDDVGFNDSEHRFRKIRPHTPDAEDAETIRLLNGKPAKVPA